MNYTYLIVGLGNPGDRYLRTRHNIGWLVIDEFARRHGVTWSRPSSLWEEAEFRYAGKSVFLAKPLTYMNDSGKAVRKLAAMLGLKPASIIAIVDEYNFPVGKIHLRPGGSDGGHNGITSLIEELGSPNFWRLRCGIDRNFGPGQLVDYVLSPFAPFEEAGRDGMIADAIQALDRIVKDGPERAMQVVNAPRDAGGQQ